MNPFKRIKALEWKVEALLIKLETLHSHDTSRYEAHLKKAPKSVLKEIEREQSND